MGKEVRLNIRITPQFKAELQKIARFHGLSLSSYIHSVMVRQLRREHETNPEAFGRSFSLPAPPAASFAAYLFGTRSQLGRLPKLEGNVRLIFIRSRRLDDGRSINALK